MNKKDLIKWGSETARGGFRNEDDIVRKFNDWEKDEDDQKWLAIMDYSIKEIDKSDKEFQKIYTKGEKWKL